MASKVGYTGGSNSHPTYESVCNGDGHTEAVKLEFDPAVISYEDLVGKVLKEASPGGFGDAQYQSAVWPQDAMQEAVAKKVAAKLGGGKAGVPILPKAQWTDAEEYHQKYYAKARY